jgi:hypothetical protein
VRSPAAALAIFVLVASALAGCAGSGPETGGGGGGDGGTTNCKNPPPPTLSFSGNIQPIYNRSCATSTACHIGPTSGAGLQLQQGAAYGATVNQPSTQRPGLLIVKPGDPDASYLVRKIEGARGISGDQMPQGCPGTPSGGAVCPTNDEITAIRTWIMECAPNN